VDTAALTNTDPDTHVEPDLEPSFDLDVYVQCEKCRKWFGLPQHISPEDLPDVFKCTLRWWDLPSHNKPCQGDWCGYGRTNRRLVDAWLKILQDRELGEAVQTHPTSLAAEPQIQPDPVIPFENAHQTDSRPSRLAAEPQNQPDTLIPFEDAQQIDSRPSSIAAEPPNLPSEPLFLVEDADVQHDPLPEGTARTRNKELAEVCKFNLHLAQWYASHVARGKLQQARIKEHKNMLHDADKQGICAMLTIDMKGKTVPDKNKAQ
jgi:hypothetical protein